MSMFMVQHPGSCLDGFVLRELVLFFCIKMLQGMYRSVKGLLTVINGLISTHCKTDCIFKIMLIMPIRSETGVLLREITRETAKSSSFE